jgi:hypothetical protein
MAMTRIVGSQPRDEFILDPDEALRRGRRLDAMLANMLPPRPSGVVRAPHEVLNRLDDQRLIEIARRVQAAPRMAAEHSPPVATCPATHAD